MVKKGSDFIDEGYQVKDGNKDISSNVLKLGYVDPDKEGTYNLVYAIKNKDKTLKLIKQELDNMKEVTKEELITAKTEMISTYIESQDSIASVSNAEFRRDLYT
mgnify:CR=1 FL=1